MSPIDNSTLQKPTLSLGYYKDWEMLTTDVTSILKKKFKKTILKILNNYYSYNNIRKTIF